MVEGRLRRRARASGLTSWRLLPLSTARSGGEREHLINAVTTNKTDFFREPRHFDYLAQTILPALPASGASYGRGARPARPARSLIPLAMVLDDFAQANGGPISHPGNRPGPMVLATAHKASIRAR
jgi:chemotaxis protein methyltransferase CheR